MKVKLKHKLASIANADMLSFVISSSIDLWMLAFWISINSTFYISFCFPLMVLEKLASIYFWFIGWSSSEPFGRYNFDYFLPWLFADIVILVLLLIIFARPYNLAGEVFGYGLHPYAGKSSCSTDTEKLGDSDIVYSTEGMFTSSAPFDPDKHYAFCVLNQRWASSSQQPIPGYARTGGTKGKIICSEEQAPGYMYSQGSKNSCGDKPYKHNLAYGLNLASVKNLTSLYQITNTSIVPCKTTLEAVEFDPVTNNLVVGVGKKIRPVCLNAHRLSTGDLSGPSGYEEYIYDESREVNGLCIFCPGGPEASQSHWLANEGYSPEILQESLNRYIILLSFKFMEIGVHLIIYKSLQQGSSNEQKKKRSD